MIAHFHPVTRQWFEQQFDAATPVQLQAWQSVARGQHCLLAAPTGSGKTLAAFLHAINELLLAGLDGRLKDETSVLYISPLKALSNDIEKNLQLPINGIRDGLLEQSLGDVDIRAMVRTGDTTAAERNRMRRCPPHILVTTPESLGILLTSESGRRLLAPVKTVIVDEIHALAGNKRGAHLMLSLERLAQLCRHYSAAEPMRIGISATQKPMDTIASYLVGNRSQRCNIIDTGHRRQRDLKLVITETPLQAVMANETWEEIYDRLEDYINEHRTTLIFVNTRRASERIAHRLAERLGEEAVTAHHGSLSREHRLRAEQQLKQGGLKALVATASLELGIDIGDVDLVCQIGSPGNIAVFLQRVGRSGHQVNATPKGRLFPLSRDELAECTALLHAIEQDTLDALQFNEAPLDVLAQQIVAEVANGEWSLMDLYHCYTKAWPYRELSQEQFKQVVKMLNEGFTTRRGRRGAYVHHDAVNGILRPKKAARLVAVTNTGAIPDLFDYDVILQPEGFYVGSLNEDFAFESLPGDIFQLGNTSYRMLKIENGRVFVEDAKGQPPNIPFWFGEAPGRSDELSEELSILRRNISQHLQQQGQDAAKRYLQSLGLNNSAATQLTEYYAAAHAALGALPDTSTIIFERFFDDTGDMHLVIHAPFGSRLNRAWGLALRKRFCRKFNFELQAAAMEDSIVLSLGATHSFPLDEVVNYLNANTVREILIQAMLDAPMFATHWRWNANISLAIPRNRNGKKVPAFFQRNDAEDLIALVFPDQLACFENISGDRQVPDHPLVNQTIEDCLQEVMDIQGLENLLRRIANHEVNIICKDLSAPSPLAHEIINAKPYAFLDDTPAEERRTLAIRTPRQLDVGDAAKLAQLSHNAVDQVKQQAWPRFDNEEELHEALVLLAYMSAQELKPQQHQSWLESLYRQKRLTRIHLSGSDFWVSAERLAQWQTLCDTLDCSPQIEALTDEPAEDKPTALREILRSRLEGLGPVSEQQLGQALCHIAGISPGDIQQALLSLEQEGFAVRGHFDTRLAEQQWCERRLLARMHQYSLKGKRREIQAVSQQTFMQFLLHWQHLDDPLQGQESLQKVIAQLEGFPIAASAWEKAILSARIRHYNPDWLDNLCNSGRSCWLRCPSRTGKATPNRFSSPVSQTPIQILQRSNRHYWLGALNPEKNTQDDIQVAPLSGNGQMVYQDLQQGGALFFDDLQAISGLLASQLEQVLGELVNRGLIHSDSFAGLRALITPAKKGSVFARRPKAVNSRLSIENAGRWSCTRADNQLATQEENVEYKAKLLLERYGIVFKRLLERETDLPPWRELLYVYHRWEAQGKIRGGRFVDGFSGEQFALNEALVGLKRINSKKPEPALIVINACDPLNLTGNILAGKRVNALAGNRIVLYDGVVAGVLQNGNIEWLAQLEPGIQAQAQQLLLSGDSTRMRQPGAL